MSVPAWKQAIIERHKKQEDEQKEKQAKEEAYLSSMPPWKRALFQKREKEKQQQQEKEKASGAVSRQRSNSFRERQQQLAQERESHPQQRRSSSTSTGGGWGRRATPPSSPHNRKTTPPVSPGYGVSHNFFGSASSSSKEHTPPKPASSKHVSVTTLPGVDDVASQKVASVPHVIPHIVPSQKSKPGSSAVMSAATHWRSKVVSNTKKSYENKPQSTEIPAWKKALLQRRKEKETKSEQPNSPKEPEPPVPAPSLPIEKTPSPPEVFDEPDLGVSFRKDRKEKRVDPDPVSLLVMKRKPSPEEANTVAREPSLPLQRKASPVEQRLAEKAKYSPTPEDTPAPPQLKKIDPVRRPPPPASVTQPRKTEPKPLSFGRKPSPVELVGAKSNGIERSSSPTGTRNRVSSVTSMSKSYENKAAPSNETPSNEVATERGLSNHQPKLIPKRSAPAPPPPSTKTQPQRAPQQSSAPASRPPARRKPAPEVVNRNSSEPPTQSTAIQTEGVTHRAPVYKEVNEWANVSEKDPKFLSLPTWKQALIKRRRADVAKRMGRTTSIDDVLLSNGPVPSNEKLPWNPPEEKKHLGSKQSSSNQGNVTALLGRFRDRRTPPLSPTSPTSPKPTVTISQPRSPSPSSEQSSSSRPAYTSSGVPPTSTTRKSFTWTPGDDTMPDEALSDDSSEEGGEYAVTAIDDVSSDEEDSDRGSRGEEDAAPAVVLLRPPQAISSATRQPTNLNKKKNSILVTSSRPKKRVSPFPTMYVHIYTFQ